MSSQSIAAGSDFTQKILTFINTQTEVQKLIEEKSKNSSCESFGELAGMSKEVLQEFVKELDEAKDNSKEADGYRDNLKNYPKDFVDLIFAQAECGGGLPGNNGVSVTVGIRQDGTFVLLDAAKY